VHVADFASSIRPWSIVLYYARAFQHATETEDNLSVKKMFIIYLSLILMKTYFYEEDKSLLKKKYQRRKSLESRMHKLMNILEVKEIDFDAKVLYCNSFMYNL
jgi:hypothetical protein